MSVTAGTLGGFVRVAAGLAILSNNHVLAASDAAHAYLMRRRLPCAVRAGDAAGAASASTNAAARNLKVFAIKPFPSQQMSAFPNC